MLKNFYFSGFGLFEVLIATFILTFCLLGMSSIHLQSFKRIESSYWHALAISQLISMAEQQRIFGNNFSDWSKDCERLLPRCKCKCDNGQLSVCWGSKQNRQCLYL